MLTPEELGVVPSPRDDLTIAKAKSAGMEIPGTWVVTHCRDCMETWTIDAQDFDGSFTTMTAVDVMNELMDAHLQICD